MGPASTLGLDVAGTSTDTAVSQVTSTTDAVVQTTQQTVSTVQTTVQTTVQETVQAAPVQAPAAAAAPSAPAPSAAAPVEETVSRTTGAVTKRTGAVVSRPTALKQVVEKTSGARRSVQAKADSLPTAAAETATNATRGRTAGKRLSALSTRSGAAADEPAATCISLPLLDLLPGTAELSTLLSLVCNAGGLLAPAPESGTSGSAGSPTAPGALLKVLGVALAGVSSTTSPDQLKLLSATADPASAVAAGASGGHTMVAGFAGSGATNGSGPRIYPALAGPEVAAATAASADAAAIENGHHGAFSQPVDGTSALALILIIDAALLAALVLWRLAQRWVVPRFA